MTREDAYALGNIIHQEVITFYESQFNEIFKKCNIYPQYLSFRGNTNIRSKLINLIYNDHEAQMKAKDEEIERLNCRAYHAEGYTNDLYNHPKDKKVL